MLPWAMPTMPLASLSPSPVVRDDAHHDADGRAGQRHRERALGALREQPSMRASPMRVSRRIWLVATATTKAQKPAKSGERPSTRKYTSTAGPASRCRSRRSTAPSRGSSARDSTGSPRREASKWTITPTATK